jgi:hypothetical protein
MDPPRQSCVVALCKNVGTRENQQGPAAKSKRHSARTSDGAGSFQTPVSCCQSVATGKSARLRTRVSGKGRLRHPVGARDSAAGSDKDLINLDAAPDPHRPRPRCWYSADPSTRGLRTIHPACRSQGRRPGGGPVRQSRSARDTLGIANIFARLSRGPRRCNPGAATVVFASCMQEPCVLPSAPKD